MISTVFRIGLLRLWNNPLEVVLMFGVPIVFFSIFFLFGRKYFQKIMDWIAGLPTSQGLLAFSIAIALFYAWAAE